MSFLPLPFLLLFGTKKYQGISFILACQYREGWPASGSLPVTPKHTAFQEAGEHEAEEKKPEKKQKVKNEKGAEQIHKMKFFKK